MATPSLLRHAACVLFTLTALTGCAPDAHEGAERISVVGGREELVEPLGHIGSAPAHVVLPATAQGLVALDVRGDAVPALAQRWIVVDDGRSYIFRLRRSLWTNGDRVDAREVVRLLRPRVHAAARQAPFGDMAAVTDILAMTNDVIEIRLDAARPDFLAMLAQPELAIARASGGTGPYHRTVGKLLVRLSPIATGSEPAVAARPGNDEIRLIRAEPASKAIARFKMGQADLVLGGTFRDAPLLEQVDIAKRARVLDPVNGLFGLAVRPGSRLLADPDMRKAVAMAIDRAGLASANAQNGWSATEALTPPLAGLPGSPNRPPWADLAQDERRNQAQAIVAVWKSRHKETPARLSLALGFEPGERRLFRALSRQLAAIGLAVERGGSRSDLLLIDRVAPYPSAFWYLGQLSCAAGLHCDREGDKLLAEASTTQDDKARAELLGKAQTIIAEHGGFIPLGTPIRWSLVSGRLTGFVPSAVGLHPLDALIKGND